VFETCCREKVLSRAADPYVLVPQLHGPGIKVRGWHDDSWQPQSTNNFAFLFPFAEQWIDTNHIMITKRLFDFDKQLCINSIVVVSFGNMDRRKGKYSTQ
jgi:hypothetical protein